ncbi:1-aminocyclopropane-1-carboxylate deaminase/D-cysteine desulfhydrase [Alteromonas genovensis]|uniref:1-aminocyclopropane-1-carboxylate deaminase/D-cysteine desulfhydrase n=1 Tax=Alteromonas genovensis TaxID=471225 RepID=UPI002FE322EE
MNDQLWQLPPVNKLTTLEQTLTQPSPLELFTPDWPGAEDVTIYVKRDDKIHPVVSGNKWRKLKQIIYGYAEQYLDRAEFEEELPQNADGDSPDAEESSIIAEGSSLTAEGSSFTAKSSVRLISFGGGFSNHLHALGYVCHTLGIPLSAIIRGDYSATPTPMISDLTSWNVDIEYVDRITYKKRDSAEYLNSLKERFSPAIIIPEGGSQEQAVAGVAELVSEITEALATNHNTQFDTIIAPVASGATMAGIVSALTPNQHAIGIGVLKGQDYLESLVNQFLPPAILTKKIVTKEILTKELMTKELAVKAPANNEEENKANSNWHINHDYHCGGYAKAPPYLKAFCENFNHAMPFKVEPVYSGKVFFALKDMLKKGTFKSGSKIIVLHTGGLQGAR